MALQVLEGTWEEIRAHEPELAGQHVRLTVFRPERPTQTPQAPQVIYDSSSDSLLTGEVRDVLEPFIDRLLADIQQNAIHARKIEIRGVDYPDDGSSLISIWLWMMCGSDDEMWRYYEDFCGRVDKWLNSLTADRKSVYCSNISFMTWRVKNA